MTFTFQECFSSECGHCSKCCGELKDFKFISPYDDTFSNTQDKEVKEVILKAKRIQQDDKFKNLSLNTIFANIMKVKTGSVYIPLDKRIKKEKENIEKNKETHLMNMLCKYGIDLSNPTLYRKEKIRRLPEFSPCGLPDLDPDIVNIPHSIPDYNDKEVMKNINEYREKYWNDMETLMLKYNVKSKEEIGDLPKLVILSDKQYENLSLPGDINLEKNSTFTHLPSYNYCCDNIKCLDMNSIYCCETRTLDIPIYTHDNNFELCALCLMGRD